MVAINVTAVSPSDAGFVTAFPCGQPRPDTSNVNYFPADVVPNLVLARIGIGGSICVYTAANTDVVIDLVGYVPAGSALVPLAAPVRRVDTRDPGGPPSPVQEGQITELTIAGRDGIPPDAQVVTFNLTAIAASAPGYLTAYPCGSRPDTSSVNYLPGEIVPNLVTSRVSDEGTICIYNRSDADFIVDLAASATDGIYTLRSPRRITDTRDGNGPLAPGATLRVDPAGEVDVPDDATAAIYNLTSIDATAPGFATSYPCDVVRPSVSNLNYSPGDVSANGTITRLSSTGEFCIFTLASTHLIVDLIGYTAGSTHYVPVNPKRIHDSRAHWQPRCGLIVIPEYPYDLDRSVYTVVDLRTGNRTRVRSTFDLYHHQTNARAPYLTRDCSTLLTAGNDAQQLVSTPILGGPRTLTPVSFSTGTLSELPDGTLVSMIGSVLTDVASGEALWSGTPGYQASLSELSEDGTIAMISDFRVSGVGRNVQIWNTVTGRRLSSLTVPGGTTSVHLSGDGQYIVLDTKRFTGVVGDVGTSEGHAILMTITGRVVQDLATTGASYTRFVSGGSMLTYLHEDDGTGTVYRWDVDGRLTPIMPSTDPALAIDSIDRQRQAQLTIGR